MRKARILFLMVLMLGMILIAMSAAAARAEATLPGVNAPEGGAPYTWELLATTTGATAATLLIVQVLKLPLDRVWKVPTRAVVVVIAFSLMLAAQGATKGLTWPDVPLVLVNACMVALAAMGTYEVSFAKMGA